MSLSAPRHSLTARLIAWAALTLFAIRAVVPAGFMLDVKALASERYSIVICSPQGLKTITLDANGAPVGDQDRPAQDHAAKASTHCPFAAAVAKALPPPEPLLLRLPQHNAGVVAWRISGLELPPILAGPPAGARAPPSLPPTTI